ncbi:hypothetical protein [Candidatus Aquarickettsia rohweri]|uniref:Uncharacterized protein n=1 Tax=Candidatus Aquarickettsia rohweri TaxID=2602574 RepID=A0A3R9ZR14_9RICK|nr:hypothetical protein [Candidatus Aquarickettsia rohweri]RST71562.1 hypothetical protein EIC27_00790 [Candidatus Aquarickettsia rohweri]
MKKVILSGLFIIIVIVSNFVFRYLHVQNINDKLQLITVKLSEKGLKFTYDKLIYEGWFFWNISGKVLNPSFYQEKHGISDQSSLDYINFQSSLFNKTLSIIFADNINTIIKDSGGESKYISTFSESPRADFVFKGYFKNMGNNLLLSNNLEEIFTDYFKSVSYNSSNHVAKKVNPDGSEEKIYSIDKTIVKLINLSSVQHKGIKLKLEVDKNKYFKNNSEEDFYNYFAEIGANSTNLNVDVLFNFEDDSKLELIDGVILENVKPTYKLISHEFKFDSDLFNFDLAGNMVINKTNILPFFDLNFKVDNFSGLVDFYSNFYNKFVIDSGINKVLALKEIREKEKNAILKTAEQISEESSHAKKYDFKIVNLKDKKVKINDYSINKVSSIYNSFLSEGVNDLDNNIIQK